MQIVIGAQLVITILVVVITGLIMGQADALSVLFGAAIGISVVILTKRSADRALLVAEENPRYGFVAMYSGLVLRYAVVILGLLVGFRVLHLAAIPLIGGFILMIIVQVITSFGVKPDVRINGTD